MSARSEKDAGAADSPGPAVARPAAADPSARGPAGPGPSAPDLDSAGSESGALTGDRAGRVLVTGASGFVGSHLLEALIAEGYVVRVLVRKSSRTDWVRGLPVELAYGDVRDKASLAGACVGVQSVFHFAARTAARTAAEFHEANAVGTRNLAEALAERGLPGGFFVMCSSLAAGGPAIEVQNDAEPYRSESDPSTPITPYGKSKLAGERMLQEVADQSRSFRVVVLRPPAVYGPRDSAVLQFFQWVSRGILPLPAAENARISLIYVGDLVTATVQVARKNVHGTYYLCDGAVYTWTQIGELAGEMMDRNVRPVRIPEWAARVVAGGFELAGLLTRRPPIVSRWKVREMRERHWVCSAEKARRDWEFNPQVLLEDGLDETLRWYRENRWL